MEEILFRVNKNTDEKKLSGAIVKTLEEGKRIRINSIGSKCNYIVTKSLIIARSLLAGNARDIKIIPGFEKKEQEDVLVIVYVVTLL